MSKIFKNKMVSVNPLPYSALPVLFSVKAGNAETCFVNHAIGLKVYGFEFTCFVTDCSALNIRYVTTHNVAK